MWAHTRTHTGARLHHKGRGDSSPTSVPLRSQTRATERLRVGVSQIPTRNCQNTLRRLKMQARSSARQLCRSITASATACGYCRFLRCWMDTPRRSSRSSSTCSSSIKTLSRVNDHESDFVVEPTDRRMRGRTTPRQRVSAACFPTAATRPAPERLPPGAGVCVGAMARFRRRGIEIPENTQ